MRESDNVRGNIAFLRKKHGWTQAQLAKRLGIQTGTLGAYEEFRSVPPLEVLVELKKIFVIDYDSFFETDLRKGLTPSSGLKKPLQ